jgi:hypothetical protein
MFVVFWVIIRDEIRWRGVSMRRRMLFDCNRWRRSRRLR